MQEYVTCQKQTTSVGTGESWTFFWCGLIMVVVIGGFLGLVGLMQKHEIASIDSEIANCVQCIEALKPAIRNNRTELEALKGSHVLALSARLGMNTPEPGQVCMMGPGRIESRNNMMIASRAAKTERNGKISMATLGTRNLR